MKNKIDLFLDSGAFSAFTQKIEIDINKYIQFIKKHKKYIDVYANLDVIGNAEATYRNQKIMEEKGLHPIPVFHATKEPLLWLKKYVDEGYSYIAIGGMAGGDISVKQIYPVLDEVFNDILTDSKGIPKVKIHGFGLTSLKLMLRYPWYSVDSTSWIITGCLGSINVPCFESGKYVYNKNV